MKMFDFALDVERAGREFYQQMATTVHEPGPKRIFSLMAEDERKILADLTVLRQRAEQRGMADAEIFSREDNVYLRQRPEQLRAGIHEDVDAYHLILGLLDKVCQVYEQPVAELNDPKLSRELRDILSRERGEYEEMLELYDFANAPNETLAWGDHSNLGEYPRFGHEA